MMFALCGATVVVSLDPVELLRTDVTVADGRILTVGPALEDVDRRDCTGTLIVPGNVCAHHHLYSALARGMPFHLDPPENFLQILQRVWWRLDRALDENAVRLSALSAGLAAMRAGTTTIVDHHASPNAIDGSLDVIADALEGIGLRSVLCYEVSDRDGPDLAAAGVAENRRFLSHSRPLARGMVGAHAPFTLSSETLRACAQAADEFGVGVHIHVAEDDTDGADSQARFGTGPVDRLRAAGVLTERALLAHCVRVTAADARLIADSQATVVHNMRSNMNNAVGRSPLADDYPRVALGTDGVDGDMFAESQAAYFRGRETSLAIPAGWPLARLAQGARLVATAFDESGLGSVRAGAPADLVVLDYPAPTPLDAGNLAGHWVFGLGASRVRDVYVAGEQLLAAGRATKVDEEKVAAEAHAEAERLWRRLGEIGSHPFAPTSVAAGEGLP
jgi:putative selenium metabolism protein SsnA